MPTHEPLRILSLSTVFPSRDQPGLGPFVRSRLAHMANAAEVVAVVPSPIIEYQKPRKVRVGANRLPPEERFENLRIRRPRWFYPPSSGVFTAHCLAWRMRPYLQRLRQEFPFDVIDSHFGHPSGIAAAYLGKWLKVPFSMTLRGNEVWLATQGMLGAKMAWAMREAVCTISVSDELRDLAVSLGADASRARTIPNGIDADRFHPGDKEALRGKFGVRRKMILSVGELIPRKGHDTTIQALRQIVDEGHDVELRIAGNFMGGGPDATRQLRDLVTNLNLTDRVHFLGWISADEVADWQRASDFYCLPSQDEGWPNSVQEALATGRPVVSTTVGAIPQMIPSDEYGYLVKPGDVSALTDALRKTVTRTWDEDAICRWGQRRSWAKVGEEVVDMLAGAVEASRSRVSGWAGAEAKTRTSARVTD